jgi:catechol 2,3-dioxygenase-like lactoylglutathione lyase family enzyme
MSSVEIDRSSLNPDPRPVTRPGIPRRHHHLAYSTHDTRATIEFYTRVMGMSLVGAVIDDRIPSTNDAYTYLHTFFRMEDGACLAFFESPGVPQMPPIEQPAHRIFNHLALEVPTREDVDRWYDWLTAYGLEVLRADHGIIYSIYFFDPVNHIRLELTATIDPTWNDRSEQARRAVEQWFEVQVRAESEGRDVAVALREFAQVRRNRMKSQQGRYR